MPNFFSKPNSDNIEDHAMILSSYTYTEES